MKTLSEKQKVEAIEWLKKQRDGYIIGDYRNILYQVYQEIKSNFIKDGYCTLQKLVKKNSIHYRTTSQVLELCEMLNTLGYIYIYNHKNRVTLGISKPIDF